MRTMLATCMLGLVAMLLGTGHGPSAVRAADEEIAKPGALDLDKLQAILNSLDKESSANALVGGYLCPYGGFDITADKPNAMLILRDASPFGKVLFHHLPIELVATDYTDPSSGIKGDVYRANVPGNGRRYYLLGVGGRTNWVVFYDAQGKVELYVQAQIGFKKS